MREHGGAETNLSHQLTRGEAKAETAAPRQGATKPSKMETRERVDLKTVSSAPGGKSGKIKQASGRKRAAKWGHHRIFPKEHAKAVCDPMRVR